MMGLQVAANKRKYEIGACTDINDIQPNCTPAKTPRLDTQTSSQNIITLSNSSCTSTESTSSSTINDENAKVPNGHANTTTTTTVLNGKSVVSIGTNKDSGILTLSNENKNIENGKIHPEERITLTKLNTVSIGNHHHSTHSWKEDEETVIDPISKLQAVAVPDEAWGSDSTRSTLATTLLSPDDLDEDMDDFDDDFDDDDAILSSHAPMRYPMPSNKGYIPAYPRPGYFPEQYHNQNCSRTPGMYNRYGSWNNQYQYHNEPMPVSDPPQTIRCAENGKSYTELGNFNIIPNTIRYIKRCCDGKNGWCNFKQCYRDKRMRMMNLSMFKLSRFRQASDQSLYRSVLICNTLKSIEKELEMERREMKRQQQQAAANAAAAAISQSSDYTSIGPQSVTTSNNSNSSISNRVNRVDHSEMTNHNNDPLQPKNNNFSENNPSNNTNNSNLMNNSSSNYLQSYTNHNRMQTPPPTFDPIPPPYEYHPLKDPQSGRATPFPSTTGYPDTDSGYGEEGDLAPDGQFRSINWGSVLSLSSQSALDPLNNNELFASPTPTYISSSSNSSNNATSLSSTTTTNNCQQQSSSCTTSTTTTLTPLVTLTSAAQTNFQLYTVHTTDDNGGTNNWDFNYLDMDLGYDVLPNCYKLSSFGSDDFLRTPLMEPSKVVTENDMVDTFSTHIMVGS